MTSKSGNFIEDTTEISLWWGWEYLKEYISRMEAYLQEVTVQFEALVNEKKKTLTPELFREFEIDHVEECVFYYDEFPYILRNAFFLSAYALFEADRGMISRMLRKAKQKPSDLSPVIASESCQEIENYSKLRNCIAHTNGLLKKSDRGYTTLIKYVKGKGLIKERVIISDDTPELEIGLTKEFCEEVVETMQKFIHVTYKDSVGKLSK